jgi:hypothetical protein
MNDARRMADVEAGVQRDLGAAPISRARMDLLWLAPHVMQAFAQTLRGGRRIEVTADTGSTDDDLLYARINEHFRRGEIGAADLEWAMRADALAEQAQILCQQDLLTEGLGKWREALALAPCCDLYLMSVGALFGNLGMHSIAVRYLERAVQLNPQSPRIARNLQAARSYL